MLLFTARAGKEEDGRVCVVKVKRKKKKKKK